MTAELRPPEIILIIFSLFAMAVWIWDAIERERLRKAIKRFTEVYDDDR